MLPAQVLPEAPRAAAAAGEPECSGTEHEHLFTFGERRYRVRGLEKNLSLQTLEDQPVGLDRASWCTWTRSTCMPRGRAVALSRRRPTSCA